MISPNPLPATALGLIGAGAAVALLVASSPPPPHVDWQAVASEAARALVPGGSQGCGVLAMGQATTAAQRCLTRGLARRQPTWVLSQAQGVDSAVWLLLISDEQGQWREVSLDAWGWQQRGAPGFTTHERPCVQVLQAQEGSEPAFHCATP